jgi:diadenosine tetraphosphatase ApaH/serine/threonine PP2A family protein phosphatase
VKYAVIADVHSNLEALSAVLRAASEEGATRVVCAGDLVGYHADPDACVALLRERDAVCIAGNHDRVAAGIAEPDRFGDVARRAVLWTRARISAATRAFLASLPLTAVVDDRFLLFHGALHPVPNADLHLSRDDRVAASIRAFGEGPWGVRVAFFGHTHRRVVHERRGDRRRRREEPVIELAPGAHYLCNPGSVGQPRDGDPRAAFAIFDGDSFVVRFCRAPFDREACLTKAARAGLLEPSPKRGLAGLVARVLGRRS